MAEEDKFTKGGSICEMNAIPQKALEETVIKMVLDFYRPLLGKGRRTRLAEAVKAQIGSEAEEFVAARKRAQRELNKIKKTINNLLDNITSANREFVDQRLGELRQETYKLEVRHDRPPRYYGRSRERLDPEISLDGLTLFFNSRGLGGYGTNDLWMTRRATRDDSWSSSMNLGPIINTSDEEADPSLSADGSILYFGRGVYGQLATWDLWQVQITPIVDFNGDEIVDAEDMSIVVDHWGENYSLCDIGPMPWGDGLNRPGRIEPRVLKRRRHRYPLMQCPRNQLREELGQT